MKKLLTFLGAVGLLSTSGAVAVSCSCATNNQDEGSCPPRENDPSKVDLRPASMALGLTDTQQGEILTENDQQRLKDEIISRLQNENDGIIVNEENLVFDLTKVMPGNSTLDIHVNDTESSDGMLGTYCQDFKVNLYLTVAEGHTDEIETTTEDNPVAYQLVDELEEDDILSSNDRQRLLEAVVDHLRELNPNIANVNMDAFEFPLVNIPVQHKRMEVVVKGSEPDDTNPGLTAQVIAVDLELTPRSEE